MNLYEQPYDPKQPVVCFDERPCQLVGDVVMPLPISPGNPERKDYEYQRKGTCCLLVSFELHTGQRFIQVRAHRTKVDYAHFMKELAERYSNAQAIRLVQDNLNTHSPASFYEAFPPEKAFELAQRFEYHYTPKMEALAKEIHAWEGERNKIGATVRWRFTKENARKKFQKHYPTIQN